MKKLKKKQNKTKQNKKPRKSNCSKRKLKSLTMKILLWEKTSSPNLKLLKFYQVTTKEKRQILPSRSKIKTQRRTKKNNDSNTNNSNWQTAHFTKNSNKRGSNDIHFETSNKFAPLLMENVDDLTTYKLTNISSAIQRLVQIVKVTVLTMSLFRQF